jgi:beta-lactamase superfamily II metal-dependent hydrolase
MAKMTFQFLDVGMGDGTLVIMGGDSDASKQLALVDFGVQPFTKFKIGADDALKYLVSEIDRISKARKKTMPYLDHLFITHPDQDHYNRIITLIKALYPSFGFQDLSIGALTYGGAKSRYGKLIKNISPFVVDKSSIANLPDMAHSEVDGMDGSVEPNWTFANGAINVYLLSANYPTTASYVPNPLSLCLMFADQNNNKVILIGDAEREVEAQIIKNFKHATAGFLNAYALKLGHHGSLNGTSEVWVKAVKPNAVFASGDFVWAHPYCKTLEEVANAKTLKEMGEHWFCRKSLVNDERSHERGVRRKEHHPFDTDVHHTATFIHNAAQGPQGNRRCEAHNNGGDMAVHNHTYQIGQELQNESQDGDIE